MMLRKATVESVRGDFSYAYILKRLSIDLSFDTILPLAALARGQIPGLSSQRHQ